MAKINYAVGDNQEHSAFVSLTSLGVMLCMIVSVVCIKFWGFKHRLRFDQQSNKNTENNGAASGSQPVSRYKQQSSVPETVVVHGIFRKRGEDELDIVRPTQLPPVRVRNLSQSTSNLSLLLPPKSKRRNDIQTTAFEELQPPHREPPMPPRRIESQPNTPQPEERPFLMGMSYEEFEQKFRITSQNDVIATDDGSAKVVEIIEPEQEMPFSPTTNRREPAYEQRNNSFLKSKQALFSLSPAPTPTPRQQNDDRLTDLQSTTAATVVEQQQDITSKQTKNNVTQDSKISNKTAKLTNAEVAGYIRYEEVDAGDLTDFREKWKFARVEELKQCSLSEADSLSLERFIESKKYAASEPDYAMPENFNPNEMQPPTPNYATMPSIVNGSPNFVHTEETLMIDYDPRFNVPPHHFRAIHEDDNDSWRTDGNPKSTTPPHYVNVPYASPTNFNVEIEETYARAAHELSFRFPSEEPIMHEVKNLPKAVEHGHEHDHLKWSSDSDLWREMENSIKDDLMTNIETEFNKIRGSFKEDEGDLLGLGEDPNQIFSNTQRIPSQEAVIEEIIYDNVYEYQEQQQQQHANSPTNYETNNIYANLPNDFHQLMYDQPNYAHNENVVTTKFSITELPPDDDGRSFEEVEVHGKELTFFQTDASGGGYATNVEALYKEIESGDEELQLSDFAGESNATNVSSKKIAFSILKGSKRAAIVNGLNSVEYFTESENELDEQTKPIAKTEKLKDHRKVSFDLNAEEHYLSSDAQQTDSEEEEFVAQEIDNSYYPPYAHNYYYQEYNEHVEMTEMNEAPTPSKRITKMHYPQEEVDVKEIAHHQQQAQLFDTTHQMEAMNYNWLSMHEQQLPTDEFHYNVMHQETVNPSKNVLKPQPAARKISNDSNASSNPDNIHAKPRSRADIALHDFHEGITKA